MGIANAKLRGIYEGMETDALLHLHSAGTLTDEAYGVLESVLESRAEPVPNRPGSESKHNNIQSREREHCALWTQRFAAIGIIVPIICLIFNFKPDGLMKICELCWPTGFFLLAMDGHFNLAIVLISITLNAGIWAGFGWLIGYGTSNRIK